MDKFKLFDKLKKDVLDMQRKASDLETRFKSQQDELKARDGKKLFKQIGHENRLLEDAKGTYDFIENDPSMPQGWRSCNKQYPDTSFFGSKNAKKY